MLTLNPPSLRQIEDWHYNYVLRNQQPAIFTLLQVRFDLPNIDAIKNSYSYLVRKHEGLRASFPKIDSKVWFAISEYVPESHDLSIINIEDSALEDFLSRQKQEVQLRMKSLKAGKLAEAFFINTDLDYGIFVLYIHHIVSDFWSLNLLKRELLTGVKNFLQRTDKFLDGGRCSLVGYIKRENESHYLKQNELIAFWTKRLKQNSWQTDFKAIYSFAFKYGLQTKVPDTVGDCKKIRVKELIRRPIGESYTIVVTNKLFNQIQQFFMKTHASLYSIFLSSFSLLHCIITNNDYCLIPSHFSNRIKEESHEVVGNLIGTLLLLLNVDKEKTLLQFVYDIYKNFLEAISKILLTTEPFSKLEISTRSFLYFDFVDRHMTGEKMVKHPHKEHQVNIHAESPLVCVVTEYNNAIKINWTFNIKYFDLEIIKFISDIHLAVLTKVVTEYSEPIKNLKALEVNNKIVESNF